MNIYAPLWKACVLMVLLVILEFILLPFGIARDCTPVNTVIGFVLGMGANRLNKVKVL